MWVNRPLYADHLFGKSWAASDILASMENSGQSIAAAAAMSALTVSQLNRQAKTLLEQGLGRLWVEGEISNIARPASGHVYFTLKDPGAQVRAAFFRQRQRGPVLNFKDGDQVLAYGRVSLYEARGDYQLIVEQIEFAGEGALKRQFEVLKKKLGAEGLFDEERKRELPAMPQRIGIITSPSGAAVRDIISVLARRFPSIPVVIYPAAVQGESAPAELVAALATAVQRDECDVLLIARGGGSLEDLMAFNDEELARAIADCAIPIVSAVGHEVDFTIADFVADVRAPTPSVAAEVVVPDRGDWLRAIDSLATRIIRLGRRSLEDLGQSLDWLSRRLVQTSPSASLERSSERLHNLQYRLSASAQRSLERTNGKVHDLQLRLTNSAQRSLADVTHRLQLAARGLNSVSPLATLERGYASVEEAASGKVLLRSTDVSAGDDIRARLSDGELIATVKKT